MKPGSQIAKVAFAAVLAIPAVVIASVGCGSLLGGLVAFAIVGGGKAGGQGPSATSIVMVVVLAITVIAAMALAALVLSSVKFSEDDDRDDRVRLLLLGEQLLLSVGLITAMVVSGSANLANSAPGVGSAKVPAQGAPASQHPAKPMPNKSLNKK